ncbi:short transient receptor potential channel 7-like isoform X2 [Littorina saxatilis]|uniref:short transient receptor potential channel 7-like isoform X2 n=1 Tax=Littorina saxatilis TaxID=31220 RepID=UPI0038B68FEB
MYEMMKSYFHNRTRHKLLQDRLQAGLSEEERRFLEAAEIGNLDVVKELLEGGIVKVDCCDQQGRTALELAVSGNDVDVVCYLLERSSHRMIHKALLFAADNDVERISELILDHPMYRDALQRKMNMVTQAEAGVDGTQNVGMHGAEIPEETEEDIITQENITKLLREVLLRAAKRNHFQIVKKILMHGVYLDEPHDYFCSCDDCTMWRREDFKVFTTQRLDTFSALASPCYIALTEEDPIQAAFALSQKFRSLSEIEGEYKQVYQDLDAQVQNFSLALLDQCQSSDEVKTVLSGKPRRGKDTDEIENDAGDILPIIHTALRMEQKKFVAHPQCQAQIGELWFSGVPFLRYLNRFLYLMLAIPVGLVVCPTLSLLYLIAPWSRVGKVVNTPLMKFLSYTCSYLTFLVVIIVSKLYLRFAFNSFVCDDPPKYAYAIITIILTWIAGLIWEEVKQIWQAGARDYFNSLWNVIDSVMLSLLLAAFVLELVVPLRINRVIREPISGTNATSGYARHQDTVAHMCAVLAYKTTSNEGYCETTTIRTSYVDWKPSWVPDPELLSDVLFTLGTILSISRFSFIMPANEALGTMLVSFRRTIVDLFKITGMFLLVLMCFACGLATLYAPNRCGTNMFDSFSGTLFTLTWSVFGLGSVDAPALTTNGPVTSLTNNPVRSVAVETVGYYLYGVYVFASMIVLLNLLIAVMSNTFNEVQDERDVEWKFARTELWMTFIEPGTPVPPPFNVIPSPRNIFRAGLWLCRRTDLKFFLPHEGKEVKYAAVQDVMCILCRRYVRETERRKIEGEDGDKTSAEEQLRRLLERMSAKLEKRVDEVQTSTARLQRDVKEVHKDSSRVSSLQEEQMELVRSFADSRHVELDRYGRMLEENKLDILSRMDGERLQMERVLQQRMSDLHEQIYNDQQSLIKQMQLSQLPQDPPHTSPRPPPPQPKPEPASSASASRFPKPWPAPPGSGVESKLPTSPSASGSGSSPGKEK